MLDTFLAIYTNSAPKCSGGYQEQRKKLIYRIKVSQGMLLIQINISQGTIL